MPHDILLHHDCICSLGKRRARKNPDRFAIADALRFHKQRPLSRQLEIETYTWDMLPDTLKTGDIVEYVCREIDWVRGQLS